MSDVIGVSLRQLLVQIPILLVLVTGITLALVFWQRSPTAALLVLVGAGLNLLTVVVGSFVYQFIFHARNDWGWETERVGTVLSAVSFLIGVVHAGALAMLLAAAFVGRVREA